MWLVEQSVPRSVETAPFGAFVEMLVSTSVKGAWSHSSSRQFCVAPGELVFWMRFCRKSRT